MNGIASFKCVADGNPPPSVFWTKEGSQELIFAGNTYGQMHVTDDGTLKIQVRSKRNKAPDSRLHSTLLGSRSLLRCEDDFLTRLGRMLQGVRKEDGGFYICSALSVAGSSVTKAYLEVTAVEDTPPPVIAMGPANQTLPVDTVAVLPCQAFGTPKPNIRWTKDGNRLPGDSRVMVEPSGTLVIDSKILSLGMDVSRYKVSATFTDLRASDTGLYTCTASAESGETSWSASLSVEDPKNPNIIFHKTPDPATFPQPPTRPRVVDRRATSVTLSWRRNDRMGSSPLIGYTVEYFSADLQSGWVAAAHRVPSETYTVTDLKPDTSYVFLVRAENSHGVSPPTQLSERVRTLRDSPAVTTGNDDVASAQDALMTKVVELTSIEAVSSTTIRVSWSVAASTTFVEGFFVRFRDMSGGSQKFNMKTVMLDDGNNNDCLITDLRKFTEYEVFLTPFYGRLEGQPSNSLHVQTLADAPSAPPATVAVTALLNASSAQLRWAPPPPQHRNGVLLGYQLHVKNGNGSSFHSNITVNATTTSFVLSNLTVNEVSKGLLEQARLCADANVVPTWKIVSLFQDYTIRACAFTNAGLGPFSAPVAFRMDPALIRHLAASSSATAADSDGGGFTADAWFVAALLAALVAAATAAFLGVVIFRRRRAAIAKNRANSAQFSGYSDPRTTSSSSCGRTIDPREAVWLGPSWKDKEKDADGHDLYAEVGEGDSGLLTTFNGFGGAGASSDPAPYATTTLAMQNRMRTVVSVASPGCCHNCATTHSAVHV